MPPRTFHRRPVVAVALAAAALGSTAGSASALSLSPSTNLTCAAQVLTQPLLKFGDTSTYWLAPGGDFETALSGWTLKNAAVAAGNETLGVLPGTKSLKLGTGIGTAQVTTPSFCVDPLHPKFRFLVKSNSTVATLNTYINFKTPLGVTLTVPAKLNTLGFGNWALSESQPLSTAIPDVFLGTGVTASITFKSLVGSLGASVTIDNLLIDPYRRG